MRFFKKCSMFRWSIPLKTEIHKSISQLNPDFMWSYFTNKDMPYNLRKGPTLGLPKTYSFYYGTNAISFLWFSHME